MSRNLKALSLGLLAALAMAAFGAISASADPVGGHFTSDSADGHTILNATEGGAHTTTLSAFGRTVTCAEDTYSGTTTSNTVTSVNITAHYHKCLSGENAAEVTMNSCSYTFTVTKTGAGTNHSPVHLVCTKPGDTATVHIPGLCTIHFGPQTITDAVVYTTDTINGKHAITADITAGGIQYTKHGACVFVAPLGTGAPHTGASLTGSVTLTGEDTNEEPVNITATGTDGS